MEREAKPVDGIRESLHDLREAKIQGQGIMSAVLMMHLRCRRAVFTVGT